MTARVLIRPRAQADIDETAAYLAQDSPDAADRFLTATQETFEQLLATPGLGPVREYLDPKLKDLRSWRIHGFGRWLTFYRSTADGIEVVRVLHGARDLRPLLSDDGK